MGVSNYHEIFVGIRLSAETIDAMKDSEIRTRYVAPIHKFDPNTGKQNKQSEQTYVHKTWKPEFEFMAKAIDEDGEMDWDALYNSGIDFHGFKLAQNHTCEDYFIIGHREELTDDGVEKLEFDTQELAVAMQATFEPLGLWNEEWFGVWHQGYWA